MHAGKAERDRFGAGSKLLLPCNPFGAGSIRRSFLIVNSERVRPPRHWVAAPTIYSMPNMLVTGARIDIEWRRRVARISARVKRDPAMGVQISGPQTANLAADLRLTIAMRAHAEQRYAALNLQTRHLHRPATERTRPSYVRTQHVSGQRYGRPPRHTAKGTKVTVSKFPSR